MRIVMTLAAWLALVPALAELHQVPAEKLAEVTPAYDYDVAVAGGGPSGTAAAIAAARQGAKVLLIEQYAFLGGMGTVAGVNVFMDYQHVGGIFREMLQRVREAGGLRGSTYDVNIMKVVLDQMVTEAGVKVLFHTTVIGVVTEPGRPWEGLYKYPRVHIKELLIHNKSGIQTVRGHTFVDCTGDGDLAAWAGAPFEFGRPEDGLAQPMTMMFRLGGCKWTGGALRHPALEGIHMSIYQNPNPGEITFNMTRIGGLKGTSGEDLTKAEMEGRKMVMEYVKLIKENIPGFEDAYLVDMPEQIGVRETRHIRGATVLTEQQVLEGRQRGDVVARSQYNIDIHNPAGQGARLVSLKQPYDIPYRSLIPKGVDNLLVAGRPLSADHAAHSSLRIQPTCYALGQAAGTAAAMCVRQNVGPWELGPYLRELQRILINNGADLGPRAAKRAGLLDEYQAWQERYSSGSGVHQGADGI